MRISKLAAAALIVLAFASQASVAFAGDDSSSASPSPISSAMPSAVPRGLHKDAGHDDGAGHKDGDDHRFALPPVVIRPDTSASQSTSIKTGTANSKQTFKVAPPRKVTDKDESVGAVVPGTKTSLTNTASIDPDANAPVQVKKLQSGEETPAETFMRSAQVGIIAMAAGALALGAWAAVKGVRVRRESRTDFVYETES
jgi:hypothetical protein